MDALRKFVGGSVLIVLTIAPCFARPQGWQGQGQGQHQQHQQPQRQERAGQWLNQHRNTPPAQAQRELENDPYFRRLPQQRQDELRQRLQHFSNSPPEHKDQMIRRLQTFERLTPEQQQHARDLFQRFQALPPNRRADMISTFRVLRDVPPNQLDSVLNQPDFRRQYSDYERQLLKGMTELSVGPGQR